MNRYVMLTRCKDLSGLLILRLAARSAFKAGPPANVKAEMARMIGLASETETRLYKNLVDLVPLPATVAWLSNGDEVAIVHMRRANLHNFIHALSKVKTM